jgi:leader peptidase (prepilin peptidase)/N-methyltransferase
MAAIGAFLGWQATIATLMFSSLIGALAGVAMMLFRRQELNSTQVPYGPYISMAATFWIFGGSRLVEWWFNR